MSSHLYFRGTQTEPTTGNGIYDLSPNIGSDPEIGSAENEDGDFLTTLQWRMDLEGANVSGDYDTSLNIIGLNGSNIFRWRINNLDSGGNIVASSDWSPEFDSTGVHTAVLTPPAGAYELIEIEFQSARDGGMPSGNSVSVAVSDADSFIFGEYAEAAEPQTAPVLSVVDKDHESITLGWTSVDEATDYELERDSVIIFDSPLLEYQDTGLSSEVEYIYRIRAYNASGPGPWSDPFPVTTEALVERSFVINTAQEVVVDHTATELDSFSESFVINNSQSIEIDYAASTASTVNLEFNHTIDTQVAARVESDWSDFVLAESTEEIIEASFTIDNTSSVQMDHSVFVEYVAEINAVQSISIDFDTVEFVSAQVSIDNLSSVLIDHSSVEIIDVELSLESVTSVDVDYLLSEQVDAEAIIDLVSSIDLDSESGLEFSKQYSLTQSVSISHESEDHIDASVQFDAAQSAGVEHTSHIPFTKQYDLSQEVHVNYATSDKSFIDTSFNATQQVDIDVESSVGIESVYDATSNVDIAHESSDFVFSDIDIAANQSVEIDVGISVTKDISVDMDHSVVISVSSSDQTTFNYVSEVEQSVDIDVSSNKVVNVAVDSLSDASVEFRKTVASSFAVYEQHGVEVVYSVTSTSSLAMDHSYGLNVVGEKSVPVDTALVQQQNVTYDVSKQTSSSAVFNQAIEIVHSIVAGKHASISTSAINEIAIVVSKVIDSSIQFDHNSSVQIIFGAPIGPLFLDVDIAARRATLAGEAGISLIYIGEAEKSYVGIPVSAQRMEKIIQVATVRSVLYDD